MLLHISLLVQELTGLGVRVHIIQVHVLVLMVLLVLVLLLVLGLMTVQIVEMKLVVLGVQSFLPPYRRCLHALIDSMLDITMIQDEQMQ